MAAHAALTVYDGASTPVAHTFSPVGIDSTGLVKWADRVSGVFLGYPTLTMLMRYPNKTARTIKVSAKLAVPMLDDGLKVGELLATCEFVIPETATAQQRDDLLAMFRSVAGNAIFTSAVESLENVY